MVCQPLGERLGRKMDRRTGAGPRLLDIARWDRLTDSQGGPWAKSQAEFLGGPIETMPTEGGKPSENLQQSR